MIRVVALLALVFATGSDEDVMQREHVRFDGAAHVGATCRDAVARDEEPGLATIRFQYEISSRRISSGRYTGKVTFSLAEVVITMPTSISWPHMNQLDRERAEVLRRAIFHHEVGHVRVAAAVRDELNAREPVVAPDPFALRAAADAAGRDGFERFRSEERAYDALTDHGRRQHFAPGALTGADTTLVCRAA